MAINFGLANQGGGFDYLESLQAIGNAAMQRQGLQQRAYAFDQQRQQDQARVGLADRARGGDFAGARQEAALGGDFDFANALGGLDDDKLKRLSVELDAIGQLHPVLKALPPEQRAAVGSAALARAGFSPQELADMDWSDAGLDASYQMSTAGKAALAARMKASQPVEISAGATLYDPVTQQPIYQAPSLPKWQFDSESGSWLQEPGSGAAGTRPATPTPSAGDPSGTFNRMVGAESNGRQFGANGAPLTSPKGATGIAQVMPATGPEAAKLAGLPWDEQRFRTDAVYNRALGEAYYAKQLATFGGDPEAAAAAYNAGPGRVRAPRTAGDWRTALPAETRDYIRKVAPGFAGGRRGDGPSQVARPGVVNVRPPKARDSNAPSGYRFTGDGSLEPIRGGPADPNTATSRNVQSNRKAEADFRKEFDALPEVKTFKTARQQFNALRNIAGNPKATAQDDIAAIFSFMKTLDPTSTVREGEFATAQNAASVPDAVRNAFNKAQSGERLNPQQRQEMIRTAYRSYVSFRDAYNTAAENYRGYARDNGISADRVARTYTPDKPAKPAAPDRWRQFKVTPIR